MKVTQINLRFEIMMDIGHLPVQFVLDESPWITRSSMKRSERRKRYSRPCRPLMRSTPSSMDSFVLSPPRNSSVTASIAAAATFRDGILATRSIIPSKIMNCLAKIALQPESNSKIALPFSGRVRYGPGRNIGPKFQKSKNGIHWSSMIHSPGLSVG